MDKNNEMVALKPVLNPAGSVLILTVVFVLRSIFKSKYIKISLLENNKILKDQSTTFKLKGNLRQSNSTNKLFHSSDR